MKSSHLKLTVSTAIIFAFLAVSPLSVAEGQKSTESTGMTKQGKQAQSEPDLSKLFLSDKVIGMKVENNDGLDIGEISQILFDENGQATHVVLSTGGVLGLGEDKYSVPWDRVSLKKDQEHAVIDVNKDQISSEFSAFEAPEQPSVSEEPEETE